MINNDSVRNLIIRGDTQHMYSVLETSKQEGMMLMDDALISLHSKGLISTESVKNSLRDASRMSFFHSEE